MLNTRRCCHCGQEGPFSRVVTCQDLSGDTLGYLCLCESCEKTLSPSALHERILDHIGERIATRRVNLPRRGAVALPGRTVG